MKDIKVFCRYLIGCPDLSLSQRATVEDFLKGKDILEPKIGEIVFGLPLLFPALCAIYLHKLHKQKNKESTLTIFSREVFTAYFVGASNDLPQAVVWQTAKDIFDRINLGKSAIASLPSDFKLVHNHIVLLVLLWAKPLVSENINLLLENINLCLVRPARIKKITANKARVETIVVKKKGDFFGIFETKETVINIFSPQLQENQWVTIHWQNVCQLIKEKEKNCLFSDIQKALSWLNRGQ